MPGTTYSVCTKRVFDFSSVTGSSFQEIVVATAVPCFQYREGDLLLRFHSTPDTVLGSGQFVDVRVRTEAPSTDDPTTDFVNPTDLCVAPVMLSTGAPRLIIEPILYPSTTGMFGSYLRVFVRGTQPGTPAGLRVYFSIGISFKSS